MRAHVPAGLARSRSPSPPWPRVPGELDVAAPRRQQPQGQGTSRSHHCPRLGVRWAVYPPAAPQRRPSGETRLSPWDAATTVNTGLKASCRPRRNGWDGVWGPAVAGKQAAGWQGLLAGHSPWQGTHHPGRGRYSTALLPSCHQHIRDVRCPPKCWGHSLGPGWQHTRVAEEQNRWLNTGV